MAGGISRLDHPGQLAASPFSCPSREPGDPLSARHEGLSGCGQLHPPLSRSLLPGQPCLLPLPPTLREIKACIWPQRKVGQERDREQDGEFLRGCWENASLPGRVLERKKGSQAAFPAQQLAPGRGWGPGQSRGLPQHQKHKQRKLLRTRKSEDGKFQGLLAPEQVQVERRQKMKTGLWRQASVSPDVTQDCSYGCELGVSPGPCPLPTERSLLHSMRAGHSGGGCSAASPDSSRCPASSPFPPVQGLHAGPSSPALVLTCWVTWELAWPLHVPLTLL